MLQQSSFRRAVLQMSSLGLFAGLVTWILLLVHGAQKMSADSAAHEYLVRFGPVSLTHITKKPISGGFVAGLSLETGLAWYIICWMIVGGVTGLVIICLAGKSPPQHDD